MILAIVFGSRALLCKLTFLNLCAALCGSNTLILAEPDIASAAGIVAAIATLILAHWLLGGGIPLMQATIGLAFAAPAAFAAYHLVHGIVASSMPTLFWTVAVSSIGAGVFGIFAWTRALSLSPASIPTPANIESLS